MQLLEGQTVQEAYDSALSAVTGSGVAYKTCCCAHEHTPDCKW